SSRPSAPSPPGRPSRRGSRASDFLSGSGALALARAGGDPLDALFVHALKDAVDVDARRVDVVGIEPTHFDQLLDLGHRHLAGRGHHRIEVPGGLSIDEVALGIALPGLDDGQVGGEAALHYVELPVELADLLALGHQRADPGP